MVSSVREALKSGKAARKGSRGDGLLAVLRVLSVIVAGIVALVTLLPSETERRFSFLGEGRAIGDELNGVLVLAIVGVMLVVLIVAGWKSRLAWRLKMSWPLFLAGVLYLIGFAMLVSATLRQKALALFSTPPAWLERLDAEHAVAYAAFTIIVVMAWRGKARILWLALALFAYGYALELGQELVPGRDYRLSDVAANGLGIAIGLIGIFLFDLRADMRKIHPAHVAASDRRRSARGSSRNLSRRSSRSGNVGLVTLLAGIAISIVSVLLGAMAEIRFGQVVSQVTHFSAPYAFTFWIGVLVTALGCYALHTRRSRRGGRVRATR
jgi:VanZ family protein